MISIIVRTFNEQRFIGDLLDSIFNQKTDKAFEVIIVDSGSTDNTVNIALRYPVRVLRISKEKFSFGYSLNKGIEASLGDICVFISAHCRPVYNNWLEELVSPFFEDDRIGLVYGRQIGDGKLTKYSEKQIFKAWFPEESKKDQKNPFCNNANCAIRKSLWKIYKYDENLTGLEDLAFAKKVLAEGFKIYYKAEAVVYHIHIERYSQIFNRYKREAIALKHIFSDFKFTLFDCVKLFFLNVFNDYKSALKEREFVKNFTEIFVFRLMQFSGTYSGFKTEDSQITKELKEKFYYPSYHQKKRNTEEVFKIESVLYEKVHLEESR